MNPKMRGLFNASLLEKQRGVVGIASVDTMENFAEDVAKSYLAGKKFAERNRRLDLQERAIVKGEASDTESYVAARIFSRWSGLHWNNVWGSRTKAKKPTHGVDVQLYTTPDPDYNFLIRGHQPPHWRYVLVKGYFDFDDFAKTWLIFQGWKYGHDIRRLRFHQEIISSRDSYELMYWTYREPISTLILA